MVMFQSYVAVYQRVPSLTNQPCKGGVGISRHSEMGGFAPLSAQCLLVHHAELKHAQSFCPFYIPNQTNSEIALKHTSTLQCGLFKTAGYTTCHLLPTKKNKSTSIHDSATAQLQFIRVSRESTGWKGSLGSLPSSLVHFDLKCGPSYWQNISNTKKRKPARGLFILVAQSLEMMVFFRFQMDFLQNLVVRFCHRSCDLALAKDAPGHLQIHFRKGFPYMAGTQ